MMNDDTIKDTMDTIAVASGLAVFLQWIPALVGVITIVYTLWRLAAGLDHRKREGLWPFAPFGSGGPGKPEA